QWATLHGPSGGQTSGAPASHAPARHRSPPVQASPSSQAVPSGAGSVTHWPVAGSQRTASHGPPDGAQVTTLSGSTSQWPPTQDSVPLHASPSSWPAQSSAVSHGHTLVPPTQAPSSQASPTV